MSVYFDMIGELSIGKDTENFHPYSETTSKSGWMSRILNFNCINGDNRHGLKINGGHWSEESKREDIVYSFTKSSKDENGETVKGESVKIPFKDRLSYEHMDTIAEWKKFIIDLEKPGKRWALETALNKIKNGSVDFTQDELTKLGVESTEQIEEAYQKSLKKRKEFLCEWDYAEFLYNLISSGKVKGKKFHIRGEHTYQYVEETGKVYDSFIPNRIYLQEDDVDEYASENVILYYNQNSLYEDSEAKKATVSCKILGYDYKTKRNIPFDYVVAIPMPEESATSLEKKKYQMF